MPWGPRPLIMLARFACCAPNFWGIPGPRAYPNHGQSALRRPGEHGWKMDDDDLDPCHVLGWDSEFFGFRIARVRKPSLTAQSLREVMEWCGREKIRCLY